MRLKYCSLTGADDAVAVNDLSALAAGFPFLETAILLMPSSYGQPRFPTESWIVNFAAQYKGAHKAMHLCGDAFLGFISGEGRILDLMHGFQRIQLNLKFGDVDGRYDEAQLIARVRENPQWQFIIQYGREKNALLPLLEGIENHAVLFDDSAGRGLSPDSWDAPLPGHFCGYAGGMNPGNVEKNIRMIEKAAAGQTTWIDMESGIRTDDKFDLEKCRRVLETAKPYTAG